MLFFGIMGEGGLVEDNKDSFSDCDKEAVRRHNEWALIV